MNFVHCENIVKDCERLPFLFCAVSVKNNAKSPLLFVSFLLDRACLLFYNDTILHHVFSTTPSRSAWYVYDHHITIHEELSCHIYKNEETCASQKALCSKKYYILHFP